MGMLAALAGLLFAGEPVLRAQAPAAAAARVDFESGSGKPEGWTTEGMAALETADVFKGRQALVLQKTESGIRDRTEAVGPVFPVAPGMLEIRYAAKSDLVSQDNSYNGTLELEFLDGNGKQVGRIELAALFRKNNWKPDRKQVEVPKEAVAARYVARINKETPGKFWIDELSATAAGDGKEQRIRRMMFTTAQVGNLLFPGDSREVTVEVWSAEELPADQSRASFVLRDYWGAEQGKAVEATLKSVGKKKDLFAYEAKVDLGSWPLEIGRYYALHGRIDSPAGEPFGDSTSLAVLPEAAANSYKPGEVPFTSRNWDNRFADYVKLTHRLGIRIAGVWGKMDADPKKVEAPQLDLIQELGMGYLTGSPAHSVEQRNDGWKELLANDGRKMREGVRNFFEKYGKAKPAIVNLGNEPHSKGEDVKTDVEAYRIVYTEIKKIDPGIFVVGTSIGADEDYFKYGFGQWLDAYDFHVYEDALSVRRIVSEKYPAMFKKYGNPKPIWSTELGLNSQGMARQAVAAELYKKFANFFAGGGENVSWFGLLYPDPEGKNDESFGSAHNVFYCRYNKYAPKMDAIAYYNAVNAIAIKKYVEDRVYGGDIHAFLFRDRDDKAMQLWYKDKGREDLFVPLNGVNEVEVIRIDGSRRKMQAEGKGITLTMTEDPVVLLYAGGDKKLAEKTGAPAIRLGAAPASAVRGDKIQVEVIPDGVAADRVSLKAPPQWIVEKSGAQEGGKPVIRYSVSGPVESSVREADMVVELKGAGGGLNGELYYRPAVTGVISIQLLPVPVTADGKTAVKLVVENNSPEKQKVSWDVALNGEQELKEGVFTGTGPAEAYFAETTAGTLEIEGRKSAEVLLPLAGTDLYKVYRMKASVKDGSGRVTIQERPVSAFYGVPKAKKAVALDGSLDEEDWKNAPVRKLDRRDQFYAFKPKDKPAQDWKDARDLSAEIRYLWDDQYFYAAVTVNDDIAGNLQEDGQMWYQDGLQFLVDPMRTSNQKIGKYDYAMGVGKKGIQTWCYLSADAGAPPGEVKDLKIAVKKGQPGTGDITYEIAFPWSRLAPFKPGIGHNLGFTLIVNEDDGKGRDSFMTWFGNAHSKDVDTVGDLILQE